MYNVEDNVTDTVRTQKCGRGVHRHHQSNISKSMYNVEDNVTDTVPTQKCGRGLGLMQMVQSRLRLLDVLVLVLGGKLQIVPLDDEAQQGGWVTGIVNPRNPGGVKGQDAVPHPPSQQQLFGADEALAPASEDLFNQGGVGVGVVERRGMEEVLRVVAVVSALSGKHPRIIDFLQCVREFQLS